MADNPNPANDQPAMPPPTGPGIVSVNNHGRRPNNKLTPFLLLGGIAAVVIIAGMMAVNVVKAKLAGPKPKPVAQAPVLSHNFAAEDNRPPLPGAMPIAAVEPRCSDGTPGHDLKSQDGTVIRGAAGQTVRVCPDGQVLASSTPAVTPAAAIPLSGAPTQAGYVPTASSALPRAATGQFNREALLNDGKYGSAVQVPGIDDSQALVAAPTTTVRPARAEGLLTAPAAGSMEQQLIPSRTPMVQAAQVDLTMLIPKGRTIDCTLSTRINSTLAGQTSCTVSQNVYSANGKVLLIERGSEAVGEYRSGVSIGQRRLFVLWTRIITPNGVVINLDSPGADELGSTGLAGKVDNHWFERIGSAFLLSTVKDGIQYETAKAQAKSGGGTFILGNTAQAGDQIADKVLEQTINIPPTIYKNQGDRAVIYVARDLDFSNVYRLRSKS